MEDTYMAVKRYKIGIRLTDLCRWNSKNRKRIGGRGGGFPLKRKYMVFKNFFFFKEEEDVGLCCLWISMSSSFLSCVPSSNNTSTYHRKWLLGVLSTQWDKQHYYTTLSCLQWHHEVIKWVQMTGMWSEENIFFFFFFKVGPGVSHRNISCRTDDCSEGSEKYIM